MVRLEQEGTELAHHKSISGQILFILLIIICIAAGSVIGGYFILKTSFNYYFDSWGKKLISLEKQGLLSRNLGAAWQDILAQDEMQKKANHLADQLPDTSGTNTIIQGVPVKDYPSLSIVSRLNEVRKYTNTIQILDRREEPVATIKTDHTRARLNEFPAMLIKAIIASEDQNFYSNNHGYEFDSFLRAAIRAGWESISTRKKASPRGTSSITQQVAKLFISSLDESGNRMVSKSVDRKLRELRLAAALRKMYGANEILEVYLNHCVASDYGMIGVRDIAKGIFNKDLNDLDTVECIYLSRMVKWGRNVYEKIGRQCHLDMPRIGKTMGWSPAYQHAILAGIDTLKFVKPKQIVTTSGFLVDLANEFWLLYCRNTLSDTAGYENDMNLINPNSLIRRKGNLTIKLTIDKSLQLLLEQLVNNRGFGRDTTIYTDVRIGSKGDEHFLKKSPDDTVRLISIIDNITQFKEPESPYTTTLSPGDTLITNIRYNRVNKKVWHRSCFYYTRHPLKVDGQYFAYCIIDSKTSELLAYYSRDKIGSRLACLLKNRIPNGSSTAKPVFNALNFDMGNFKPFDKFNDSVPVTSEVPWKRSVIRKKSAPYEVEFEHGGIPGQGYVVHNHLNVFEGCKYIFDQLNASNNILGVEMVYRLNRQIFDNTGNPNPDAFPFAQFLYRLNAVERIKDSLRLSTVTGVRLYREMLRIIGVDIDSIVSSGKKAAVSDIFYSAALGTLELSLYEQVHIFNMLYNNDLIERPTEHPGLVISRIDINGATIFNAEQDIIKRYHPFADLNNLRPTHLGLHKRLVSNPADDLAEFDIPYNPDTSMAAGVDTNVFTPLAYYLSEPVSNYSKSGTTDDVLKPFNADPATNGRSTNYGLWNATIRVDLNKFNAGQLQDSTDTLPDIHDITIACVGECNQHYTGERDGKTLHKYLSRDLLKTAGIKYQHGFFEKYEHYIKKVTPDSLKFCGGTRYEEDLDKNGEKTERFE